MREQAMTPGASGPGAIHQVLLATAVAAMLCAVGILHVASKVSAVEAGYKLGQLEDAHRVLERDNASLKLQVATLRSAAHIEVAAREQLVSTYMGSWLAIPHGTDESKGDILASALCLIRYDEPIEWGAGQPVRVVVGIAGVGEEHLSILSRIALIFSDPARVEEVLAAAGPDELYALIQQVNE